MHRALQDAADAHWEESGAEGEHKEAGPLVAKDEIELLLESTQGFICWHKDEVCRASKPRV